MRDDLKRVNLKQQIQDNNNTTNKKKELVKVERKKKIKEDKRI